jgi:hypothetical protein
MFEPSMADHAKIIVEYLKQSGIESSVKTSRYQTSIKAVEINSSIPVEDLLKSVKIIATTSDLTVEEERNISGRYKAKLVTLTKKVSSLSVGDKFFIVNTFSDRGTLKSKALAPEKLNLTSTKYKSINVFDRAVETGISNLKIESDIKRAMVILYQQVQQDKNEFTPELSDLMKKIRPGDVQVIGKDYGEVLSLRWSLNHTNNIVSFGFSESIQAALVDFFIVYKQGSAEVRQDYSAKYEEGGAPSIKSVVGSLDVVYKTPNTLQTKAIDVLKALGSPAKLNTSMRILQAAETVNLAGNAELKTIIGVRQLTLQSINDKIGQIAARHQNAVDRIAEFRETFAPFYNKINKKVTDDSLKVVFASTKYPKFYAPIISPFGYRLVDYLNATPIYQEMLNNVSRQSSVSQVYLNLRNGKLEFEEKTFKGGSFKFEYGSNAKDSDNTGIKFSMIKTK